jgi:hypothetical protein
MTLTQKAKEDGQLCLDSIAIVCFTNFHAFVEAFESCFDLISLEVNMTQTLQSLEDVNQLGLQIDTFCKAFDRFA